MSSASRILASSQPSQWPKKYKTSIFMKDLLPDEADELNLEYRSDVGFSNSFMMNKTDSEVLLRMIDPKISINTSFREAITASECLAVTLRSIATRDSFH
nr:unnamed protein product [Callosobruchus analis]